MKSEAGSFLSTGSTEIIVLNDDTINVKAIFFQISKNSTSTAVASTGFSDSIANRAKAILEDSSKHESKRSTTYSILHYENVSGTVTLKIAGKVPANGFSTTGEFVVDFDNYDSTWPIDFMVIGD